MSDQAKSKKTSSSGNVLPMKCWTVRMWQKSVVYLWPKRQEQILAHQPCLTVLQEMGPTNSTGSKKQFYSEISSNPEKILMALQRPPHGKVNVDTVAHCKSWKKIIRQRKAACLQELGRPVCPGGRQSSGAALFITAFHISFYLLLFSAFQDHKSTETGLGSLQEKGGGV